MVKTHIITYETEKKKNQIKNLKTQNKDDTVNKIYESSCDQNYASVLYLALFMCS